MNHMNHIRGRQPQRDPIPVDKLQCLLDLALENAWDLSTRKAYQSHLLSYLNFVHLHHFDIDPTEHTLALYIVFMCQHIKPTSVEVYLTGICHSLFPYFPNVRTVRNSPLVKQALKGCLKLYGTPVTRKRPLLLHEVEKVANKYSLLRSHDDTLFLAQLLVGFFALLRLGELVYPNDRSLDAPRKMSRRESVTITQEQVSFTLPYHKCDRFFKGNEILVLANTTVANPVEVMQRYLFSRDLLFPASQDLWIREDGSRPRRDWFLKKLRAVCGPEVGGHSLRAGGATSLAQHGVPLDVIQAVGRWASDTFRIYIRQHPLLIHAAILQHRT